MEIDIGLITFLFSGLVYFYSIIVLGMSEGEQNAVVWTWPEKKKYNCIHCDKELTSKDEIPHYGKTIIICDTCFEREVR